jgi:hypothetical protein
VPQGSQQFTPRQLLDAGRHAEAEGKLDLAHQFYRHLADHYGYTPEAAEGRNRLARIEAGGHYPQVWQTNGSTAPAHMVGGKSRSQRRGRTAPRDTYRTGRALAAIVSGIGWLLISGALAWLGAGVAADVMQVAGLRNFLLTFGVVLQLGGALVCGAVTVLCGQAARALFDQAQAARELLAIKRTEGGGDQS